MRDLKIEIKEIHYHRNGICGWPFYVAIAESEEDGDKRDVLIIKHDPGDFKDDPERKKNYSDTVWNFGIPIAVFFLDKLDQRKINTIANV